jgi:hypothetical protein
MKTNGQVLDLWVDLEKEKYDSKKHVIVNKSKFLKKEEDAEKFRLIKPANSIIELNSLVGV